MYIQNEREDRREKIKTETKQEEGSSVLYEMIL